MARGNPPASSLRERFYIVIRQMRALVPTSLAISRARWVKKFEAIEGIVPVRRSLIGRCAAIGMTQQRVAYLPIFVLDCRESPSQKQAQLKVGAFQPQPSVSQN